MNHNFETWGGHLLRIQIIALYLFPPKEVGALVGAVPLSIPLTLLIVAVCCLYGITPPRQPTTRELGVVII